MNELKVPRPYTFVWVFLNVEDLASDLHHIKKASQQEKRMIYDFQHGYSSPVSSRVDENPLIQRRLKNSFWYPAISLPPTGTRIECVLLPYGSSRKLNRIIVISFPREVFFKQVPIVQWKAREKLFSQSLLAKVKLSEENMEDELSDENSTSDEDFDQLENDVKARMEKKPIQTTLLLGQNISPSPFFRRSKKVRTKGGQVTKLLSTPKKEKIDQQTRINEMKVYNELLVERRKKRRKWKAHWKNSIIRGSRLQHLYRAALDGYSDLIEMIFFTSIPFTSPYVQKKLINNLPESVQEEIKEILKQLSLQKKKSKNKESGKKKTKNQETVEKASVENKSSEAVEKESGNKKTKDKETVQKKTKDTLSESVKGLAIHYSFTWPHATHECTESCGKNEEKTVDGLKAGYYISYYPKIGTYGRKSNLKTAKIDRIHDCFYFQKSKSNHLLELSTGDLITQDTLVAIVKPYQTSYKPLYNFYLLPTPSMKDVQPYVSELQSILEKCLHLAPYLILSLIKKKLTKEYKAGKKLQIPMDPNRKHKGSQLASPLLGFLEKFKDTESQTISTRSSRFDIKVCEETICINMMYDSEISLGKRKDPS